MVRGVRSRTFRLAGAAWLTAASSGAIAQVSPPPTTDEIVVTGARPGTLDLKRLRRAEAIFQAERTTFAPASTLLFQLRPKGGGPLAGMTLMLRAGERSITVPVDQLGRFTLPTLSGDGWELQHNRGRTEVAVRPLVFSPGATEADRPLGDLRLQCRVGWELMKTGYSLFARAAFDTLGGCSSSRIGIFYVVPQPISAAILTSAGTTTALPLGADHHSYRPPIWDRRIANGARIQLWFE